MGCSRAMAARNGLSTPDHTNGETTISNTKEHTTQYSSLSRWATPISRRTARNVRKIKTMEKILMLFKDTMSTALWSKRFKNSQASSGFYLELVSVQRQSDDSRVISYQLSGIGSALGLSRCFDLRNGTRVYQSVELPPIRTAYSG